MSHNFTAFFSVFQDILTERFSYRTDLLFLIAWICVCEDWLWNAMRNLRPAIPSNAQDREFAGNPLYLYLEFGMLSAEGA